MSKYRKIFHHVTTKDVKEKHLEIFNAQELEEENEIILELERSDWRNEINISKDHYLHHYLQEQMTTSQVLSYQVKAAGDVDLQTLQLGISVGTDSDPMNHGLIDFGDTSTQDDNKVVDGGGEYTVWSNLDDLGNVDDPTDAGGTGVVRAWGTDSFAGGGGHGWLITQPGYKQGMVRNAKPTGDYFGYEYARRERLGLPQLQDYDGYWHRYGSTVDVIGQGWASPGWNSNDGTTDRGMGTVLSFDGPGSPRFAALKAVDTTEVDTFKVHAHISDTSITSSYNGVSPEVHVYYWAGDKPGFKGVHDDIYDGQRHTSGDGWRPINVKPDGTVMSDVESRLIKFASERLADIPTLDGESNTVAHNKLYPYSIPIPEWCRGKNSRFMIYQRFASSLASTSFRVASVRFQRKNPITITPPLDDPESLSFMRVGSNIGSPKKRKRAVDTMLKASKAYVNKVLGQEFPGTDAKIGEAQGTGEPYIPPQGWDQARGLFGHAIKSNNAYLVDPYAAEMEPKIAGSSSDYGAPLPNQKSYENFSDDELEWNDLERNENGEIVRVMPPSEEQNRRWEKVPYKDQYGFEDGPPVGLWPPHEKSVTLPATKTWVNPRTGHRYEANNQNFRADPSSGWVNPEPGYGARIGTSPDRGWTAQHIDKDRDGVDDRDQAGPGQPYVPWPFPRDKVIDPPEKPSPVPPDDSDDKIVLPIPLPPNDPGDRNPFEKPDPDIGTWPPSDNIDDYDNWQDIPWPKDLYDRSRAPDRTPEDTMRWRAAEKKWKEMIWKWVDKKYDPMNNPNFVQDPDLNPHEISEGTIERLRAIRSYRNEDIPRAMRQVKYAYRNPDAGYYDFVLGKDVEYAPPFMTNDYGIGKRLRYPGSPETSVWDGKGPTATRLWGGGQLLTDAISWLYKRSPIDGKVYTNFNDMPREGHPGNPKRGKDPVEFLRRFMTESDANFRLKERRAITSPREMIYYYRNWTVGTDFRSPTGTYRPGEEWFQSGMEHIYDYWDEYPDMKPPDAPRNPWRGLPPAPPAHPPEKPPGWKNPIDEHRKKRKEMGLDDHYRKVINQYRSKCPGPAICIGGIKYIDNEIGEAPSQTITVPARPSMGSPVRMSRTALSLNEPIVRTARIARKRKKKNYVKSNSVGTVKETSFDKVKKVSSSYDYNRSKILDELVIVKPKQKSNVKVVQEKSSDWREEINKK